MKLPSKPVIVLISIPIAILLFFSSNIYGYFRFKHYCSAEGGLRVYEKLERNVGWLAKDKYEARTAALLDGVGFVRYNDSDNGMLYDISYVGGDPQEDNSYAKVPANEAMPLTYKWQSIGEYLSNELRLGRSGYEILDINGVRIMARFYWFSYAQFNDSKTLLDAPSISECFNEPGRFGESSKVIKELNTAFKY